jgi:hypothetical protein
MIEIGIYILVGLNVIAGLFFVITGFFSSGGTVGVSIMSALWGFMFLGLAWALWARKRFARMWAIIVYGLIGAVTLFSLIGEFLDPLSRIRQYPLIYGGVYLIWLAVAIGPVVFMLRRDVKEHFSPPEQE